LGGADPHNLQAATSILDQLAEIAAITRADHAQADASSTTSRELLGLAAELRQVIAGNL